MLCGSALRALTLPVAPSLCLNYNSTNPQLPRRFYMRFQHIYGPIMYCLLGISYTTGDVVEYFK